jgi:hypothetical protein
MEHPPPQLQRQVQNGNMIKQKIPPLTLLPRTCEKELPFPLYCYHIGHDSEELNGTFFNTGRGFLRIRPVHREEMIG